MHERERRHDTRILQVLIISADLAGEQHAFVDYGARRHRRHIKFLAMREFERLNCMPRAFAYDVELALKGIGDHNPGTAGDKYLSDYGLDQLYRLAEVGVVSRHVAPAEQRLTFILDCALDLVFALEA